MTWVRIGGIISENTDSASETRRFFLTQPLGRILRAGILVHVLFSFISAPDLFSAEDPETITERIKNAQYAGTDICASCHDKQYKEFINSTHARIAIENQGVKAQGCEACHGPGSVHVDSGGERGTLKSIKRDPDACFACHSDKKIEFRLPYHHPVLEGKMSCTDCHSPHGEEVRPWTATSLNDVNQACFKCHKEQRGPFVWEHEVVREGCTTCHKVHGSIHEKMLVARDNTLCLRCHTQANFPTIGKSSHAGTRLPRSTCFSAGCHTAVHGSNFDDHLRY